LNSQGYAEDQLIDLAGGTHLLGATYPGDNSFSAPNPNPTTQTVTITPASTSLAITATPLSVTTGGVVYLNASVLSPNIYSDIAPTGTITFYSGTTVVATAAGGDLGVNPTAHEAFWSTEASTTTIPHGQNHITATYSGDSNYASSVSTWVPVSVLYPSATSVTTSNSSISYGSPVTFTASVSSSQTGAPPITGVITFIIDGAVLSYVPLSNGSAQYTTSAVPGGEQTIQAAYSGDNNFASGNGYVQETVVPNSTTTGLTTSSSTITAGQSVTVTAMITPSMSGPIGPTGPVQFLVNGAVFMSEFAANGQAQLMTTTLPVGTDQISAKYLGDSNYTGSTSSSITLTENPAPTFTVTANSTAINVPAPGQSGSATLTFTGENGFTTNGNATVSVGCDGLPAYSSCSISPSSVNIATNGSATATLTVTTTAPSAVMPGARSRRVIGGGQAPSWNTTAAVAILLLLSGGIAFGSRGRQRPRGLALALLALVLVFANAGCGGGSSGGGTGAGGDLTNSGTPAGSANFTVSVTINGVTQTLRLTVDVQ
jgi:large repetitive protein